MLLWTLFKTSLGGIAGQETTDQPTMLSRRSFVASAAALGAVAIVAPAMLGAAPAEAAPLSPVLDPEDTDVPMSTPVEPAQYTQGSRRRRNRWRRRELARMCRNDRRFRRDNRGLCRRVTGWRERPGACIRIGAVTICD